MSQDLEVKNIVLCSTRLVVRRPVLRNSDQIGSNDNAFLMSSRLHASPLASPAEARVQDIITCIARGSWHQIRVAKLVQPVCCESFDVCGLLRDTISTEPGNLQGGAYGWQQQSSRMGAAAVAVIPVREWSTARQTHL